MRRDKTVKINLGSGPSGVDGWINYDWGWLPILSKIPWFRRWLVKFKLLDVSYEITWPKIQLVDIRKELPLSDNSIEYIYCSNVLEHLEKYQTERLLEECLRVLKSDGRIRFVLPDLKQLIDQYEGADKFCREFYGYNKDKKNWNKLFIRGHQWMYDEKSIILIIKKAGFKKVEISEFRKSKMPNVNKLDLEIHRDLCMYIEAQKI